MVVKTLATNYTVFEARDGQMAVEMLAKIEMPDVIVSDVMMPRLDGVSLAKRIKATPQLKNIPIIFLTAKNTTMEVIEGINAGARFYLAKPFKVKELLEKVAIVLKSR
jgi:DNA-binding response OmpR family regulator